MNESAAARSGALERSPSDVLVLLTLATGFVMAMIDTTAVNVALPDISASLSVPLNGLVWVVDGYTLTFAAFLIAGGALADRWGPKSVYQGGLALFLFASLLCGIAPGGKSLVAARLLQGVGASLFMPSSLSLLAHTYTDDRKRAAMLGLWSAMVGFAAATGPLIGGALIHVLGWRSVFWINVPLGLLGIALAYLLIPAAPKQSHPISWVSHAIGALVLATLSVFLIEGPSLGWHSPIVLAAAVVALIATTVLVDHERTSSATLLPRALRRMPGFAAVNLTGFLTNLGAFGQLFLLSLYLQGLGSRDPLETGLQLVPTMATVTVGNFLSSRVSVRFGTRRTMCVGYSIAAALGIAILIAGRGTPLRLLVGVSAMNFFVGMAIPAMTTTAMQIAGRTYANGAAAALNANRQIGALVGVALMGAIIHSASSWDARLMIGFATIVSSYAAAALFVYRFIGRR